MTSIDAQIGERVHMQRFRRGMTVRTLAKLCGIEESSLTRKERGQVTWLARDIVHVAGPLGVDPGDLLPRRDSNLQPAD